VKLLLVVGQFPQRSETFIYRKAVALARRGHHVTVGTRAPGDWSIYPEPLPPTLQVEVWPPDGRLRDPRRAFEAAAIGSRYALRSPGSAGRLLAHTLRDPQTRDQPHTHVLRHLPFLGRSFDIVHFEFLAVASLYPLAGELLGAPVIVSCRGTEVHTLSQRPPESQAAMLDQLRRADAVHCVSTQIAEVVTELSGRRTGLWINRPAIDTAAIVERAPRTASRSIQIVTTGRLVWQKGFDHLLAALALLDRRGVEFHAEILGDGELRKALAFSIGDLGLEGRVTLVGAVSSEEVLARMRRADVFVLSSHTEGISNAALEAMAVGLPIVTTAAGGMIEAVTDGVEGFVVPVRDASALADRIEILALDGPRRVVMGHAARARAVREFGIERQVATFEAMYEDVLRRRAERPST
jgi:colanic acid/amylovoran biosynthesis glycosyltransferase